MYFWGDWEWFCWLRGSPFPAPPPAGPQSISNQSVDVDVCFVWCRMRDGSLLVDSFQCFSWRGAGQDSQYTSATIQQTNDVLGCSRATTTTTRGAGGARRLSWEPRGVVQNSRSSSGLLTSCSTSWAAIALRTFFLDVSWISPPTSSSSRMKYAFSKLKIMSSSQTYNEREGRGELELIQSSRRR